LDTQRIVSELKAERNRLDKAITALDGANTTRAVAGMQIPGKPLKRQGSVTI
jgi:hypothetical protein